MAQSYMGSHPTGWSRGKGLRSVALLEVYLSSRLRGRIFANIDIQLTVGRHGEQAGGVL